MQDGSVESNRWTRRDGPSSFQRCDGGAAVQPWKRVVCVCLSYVQVFARTLFPMALVNNIFGLGRVVWQNDEWICQMWSVYCTAGTLGYPHGVHAVEV